MSARITLVALLVAVAISSALPHDESQPGVEGARKLSKGVYDCSSVVAFSGTGARLPDADSKRVGYHSAALDRGVGWSKDSGEFTCHCPGLYQFSFAGSNKMSLKKQASGNDAWTTVVTTSASGGANTVLLDMELGDKTAVWLEGGELTKEAEDAPSSSFSGYRIAKK